MPQDIRVSPDGKLFYVADMMADGVFVIDGDAFKQIGFIETGKGTHGLYPEPRRQEALRRQSRLEQDPRPAEGQGQRVGRRFRDRKIEANWPIPGRRQPRHGQRQRRRQAGCGCRAATTTSCTCSTRRPARSRASRSGKEPHGLTVWPQPGRYSLGHTGNMR